ncbi:MAG TPA: hypothetical protein VMK83_09875 [Gaiellaceae bacterium]|nr:hypothetical protein [Gaiellaceae bacterium]
MTSTVGALTLRSVRIFAASVVVGAALAASAATAAVLPQALVIRAADVPAGYRLEAASSGVRTNAQEAKESPEGGRLFRRWGRVTGYQVIYDRGERTIEARSDVFRSRAGPPEMLRWADRQVRLSGIKGLRRESVRLGSDAFLVSAGSSGEVYVYWRYGVVWSALGGRGLGKAQVLALARAQQRRIVSALR